MAQLQILNTAKPDPGKHVRFVKSCQTRDINGNLWIYDVGDCAHLPTQGALPLLSDGWVIEVEPSSKGK